MLHLSFPQVGDIAWHEGAGTLMMRELASPVIESGGETSPFLLKKVDFQGGTISFNFFSQKKEL